MDISSTIMQIMFLLSGSLLYPVVIILLALVIWTLIALGHMVSEYSERTRDLKKLKDTIHKSRKFIHENQTEEAAALLRGSESNPQIKEFLGEICTILGNETFSIESEKMLQDYEITLRCKLDKLKILTRTAPMLGLMGTLIPLGPALMGLTSGDIQMLASNLVIAFSTTILGLLIAGIAYALLLTKKRWYLQDIGDMEYVVDVLK